MITIYTDGATSGNGKKDAVGGWGWICVETDKKEWGSVVTEATNQICELMAVIEACEYAQYELNHRYAQFPPEQVIIRSDSAYIVNCYKDKWYKSWLNNGWKNSKKEPVANQELWQMLIPYFDNPQFSFEKVKGHIGDEYNEQADALACQGRDYAKKVYGGNNE